MRPRGGRVRTNEEMRGTDSRDRTLNMSKLAHVSSDSDMEAVGAWRARAAVPGGSPVMLRNVFAGLPNRVMYLHRSRVNGAVPPSIGNMNAYGGEGPKAQLSGDARRSAASTPPSLGAMNPYGGEGPPRAAQAKTKSWWEEYKKLEAYVGTYGFPN